MKSLAIHRFDRDQFLAYICKWKARKKRSAASRNRVSSVHNVLPLTDNYSQSSCGFLILMSMTMQFK